MRSLLGEVARARRRLAVRRHDADEGARDPRIIEPHAAHEDAVRNAIDAVGRDAGAELSAVVHVNTLATLFRAILRVPKALEIVDQGGAEVAVGLLAGIDRAIAAKLIEGFLRDPERAPIAHRADRARAGQPSDDVLDRRIHRVGGGDLVADEPSLRAVADGVALILDCLTGDAGARGRGAPES